MFSIFTICFFFEIADLNVFLFMNSFIVPPHNFNSITQQLGEPNRHAFFTLSTQQEPNTLRVLIHYQGNECCPWLHGMVCGLPSPVEVVGPGCAEG